MYRRRFRIRTIPARYKPKHFNQLEIMTETSNVKYKQSGFTLLEITIVLVVSSLMLTTMLPFITDSLRNSQAEVTEERLEAIQNAITSYIPGNGLPCPADVTLGVNTQHFGRQGGDGNGNCKNGSTPDANWNTGDVAGGMVPTKTLGLADEYAFDGWGQRIMYHVDQRLTDSSAFLSLDNGSLTVNDRHGALRTAEAAYVLASHGENGHGGYTVSGVVKSTGSTNAEEQDNCNCSATAAFVSYDGSFVQSLGYTATAGDPKTVFDDVVHYRLLQHVR